MQLLGERTEQSAEAILNFCQAVDKQLYLMLPTHIKRATLHFHLRTSLVQDLPGKSKQATRRKTRLEAKSENIVRLEEYLSRRGKRQR